MISRVLFALYFFPRIIVYIGNTWEIMDHKGFFMGNDGILFQNARSATIRERALSFHPLPLGSKITKTTRCCGLKGFPKNPKQFRKIATDLGNILRTLQFRPIWTTKSHGESPFRGSAIASRPVCQKLYFKDVFENDFRGWPVSRILSGGIYPLDDHSSAPAVASRV